MGKEIEMEGRYDFIAMDITSNCNLRCSFCLNDYSRKIDNTMMDEATLNKVITLLPLLASDGLLFFSCLFEPTLHPGFLDLLKNIPKEFIGKVFFTTNLAKRLPDEFFQALSNFPLHHINISCDSLNENTFPMMRKGARFDIFQDNLERMAKIFSTNNNHPPLRYITIACRLNLDELNNIIQTTTQKYLSSENEIRTFATFDYQDTLWVSTNRLSDAEWQQVKNTAFVGNGKVCFEELASNTIPQDTGLSDRELMLYNNPPFVALRIAANGMVSFLDMPVSIEFNINDIINPLAVFKELARLHCLDVARGLELQRVMKSGKLMQLRSYRTAVNIRNYLHKFVRTIKRAL